MIFWEVYGNRILTYAVQHCHSNSTANVTREAQQKTEFIWMVRGSIDDILNEEWKGSIMKSLSDFGNGFNSCKVFRSGFFMLELCINIKFRKQFYFQNTDV